MKVRCILVIATLALFASSAATATSVRRFAAFLDGFQEVPTNSTEAEGFLILKSVCAADGTCEIEYHLSYENLQGEGMLFSHLHLGRKGVNGGIIAFLCDNPNDDSGPFPPPEGTPDCPFDETGSGEVSGVLTADDVTNGAAGQGISAGEMDELVRALKKKAVYVNVHTTFVPLPRGEIRGDIFRIR